MHFRLALKLGNAFHKAFAIEADGAAPRLVGIKDCAKTERQNSCALEALADHMRMLEKGLLAEIAGGNVLAYQDRKVTAGIGEYLGICNTSETFYGNGTTSANTTLHRLLLNDAV